MDVSGYILLIHTQLRKICCILINKKYIRFIKVDVMVVLELECIFHYEAFLNLKYYTCNIFVF